MAKEKRQRVKFTGKRTGLDSIAIKGIGVVSRGNVVEVSEEEADRWTAELPMADDKVGSDFVKVGGVYSLDEDEAAERRLMAQEKYLPEDPDEVLVGGVNTEPAHPVADSGTAEEPAVVEDKPEKGKKG